MTQATSLEYLRAQGEQAAAVAADMLSGSLSFLEGARLLSRLRTCLSLPADDPDFSLFVAVDSETDHLPLGSVREHWSTDALARLQPEIQIAESHARQSCTHAAQAIIERFSV